MTEIYAVSMNKGGVGKSSLISNLAGAVVKDMKKKVLIIDTDGQGNASIAFGKKPYQIENTIYDVLLGNQLPEEAIIEIDDHLHILPSNQDMNFIDFDILTDIEKFSEPFKLLKKAIESLQGQYDFIFIDTPPSMGLIAGNVLAAADKVIIPFVPEMFAVQGLMRTIEAIDDFKEKENRELKIEGIVSMMVDSRTVLHNEMLQQVRKYCSENDIRMYETVIPKSIRFASSTAYEGKPATWIDYNSKIVSAYFKLMKEVFEHGKIEQTVK